VDRIDDRNLEPGPVTAAAARSLRELIATTSDP
jgi:hypothetical protein